MGRVIKFLTSFLGGFEIYDTRFGGYKFSHIKLLGFNCVAKYSALQLIKKPPSYPLLMDNYHISNVA